jgi:hypothetical protein
MPSMTRRLSIDVEMPHLHGLAIAKPSFLRLENRKAWKRTEYLRGEMLVLEH